MREGVIYIAGYGRSGSTLLDTLLGNHPQVFGAGELMWLFHRVEQNADCSCGAALGDCPLWKEVLAQVAHKLPGVSWREAGTITLEAERIFGRNADLVRYAEIWRAVFQAIRRVSGRPFVVDSSKSNRIGFRRLRLLTRHLASSVKALHLVRDPRAVMWSLRRGTNRGLEAGSDLPLAGGMVRGLMSWTFSNLAVESLRRDPAVALHGLRYEDLTAEPATTLDQMGRFLGLDLTPIIQRIAAGESFDPGHGIAGNRMRRGGAIRLRRDGEWTAQLPFYARASSVMVWPLMRAYRYTGRNAQHDAPGR